MNAIRAILGRAESLSSTIVDRVIGEKISIYQFAENGATVSDVPCMPLGRNEQKRVPGASVQDAIQSFSIPRSDVWPNGNEPANYDVITYAGNVYWITELSWDNFNTVMRAKVTWRENI